MTGRNWGKFVNDNIVLLTGIPLIIGIHWGWWRIQKNPDLIDPKDRHDMPLYSMYQRLYQKILEDNTSESATGAKYKESLDK